MESWSVFEIVATVFIALCTMFFGRIWWLTDRAREADKEEVKSIRLRVSVHDDELNENGRVIVDILGKIKNLEERNEMQVSYLREAVDEMKEAIKDLRNQ